ncbi:MAG: anaerobic ribonucleoside-triphosphate reductase activating protein [Oscillospiraceae bacterium]|nr:anaerobic ribonucleoside-triphosphate reductase activating protein [Oscillospiraceae bacterium]MCC8080122.1 anaerobic ribonucleoside-triphosphate reductase activating protein [Oscillospiraceae bacterium]
MYYGNIKNCDIADGIGVRISLFVSGCTHRCRGCFQPETWSFSYGKPYTAETENELLALLEPSYINGLTLLGGEPMEPPNQRALLPLLRRVRERFPQKDVWCYTGYTLERDLLCGGSACCEVTAEMLGLIDVLVDGEFIEEQKNLKLKFRGSENQRLIDLPRTLQSGQTVLLKL